MPPTKIAVVTGAAAGIGLETSRRLIADGVHVVGADLRTDGPGAEVFADGAAELHAVDATDPEDVESFAARVADTHGHVDVLVNNVGGMGDAPHEGFLHVTDAQWARAFELNLFSTVRVTRAILPLMLQHGGAIVNVASVNAILTGPGVVDYSAAKAAVVNLSKTLSLEFAPRGVRVNAVCPGPVATDLWLSDDGLGNRLAAAMGTDRSTAMERMIEGLGGLSLGRFGRPEEVAALICFLAGDDASWITGSSVLIDGGLVKTV